MPSLAGEDSEDWEHSGKDATLGGGGKPSTEEHSLQIQEYSGQQGALGGRSESTPASEVHRGSGVSPRSGTPGSGAPSAPRATSLQAPPHIVCEDDPELPNLVLDVDGHEPGVGGERWERAWRHA